MSSNSAKEIQGVSSCLGDVEWDVSEIPFLSKKVLSVARLRLLGSDEHAFWILQAHQPVCQMNARRADNQYHRVRDRVGRGRGTPHNTYTL